MSMSSLFFGRSPRPSEPAQSKDYKVPRKADAQMVITGLYSDIQNPFQLF